MNEVEKKVKKIVVKPDDEVTDIVRQIKENKGERISLVFTEKSDLLISPIGLKVIQEVADENESTLITQIVDNPAGERNAKDAGVMTVPSSTEISNDTWEEAKKSMESRRKGRSNELKKSSSYMAAATPQTQEEPTTEHEQPAAENLALKRSSQPEDLENSELVETAPTGKMRDGETPSEYKKRIQEVLDKSKQDIADGKYKKVEQGGMVVALDHELEKDKSEAKSIEDSAGKLGAAVSATSAPKPAGPLPSSKPDSLVGRDFTGSARSNSPQTTVDKTLLKPSAFKQSFSAGGGDSSGGSKARSSATISTGFAGFFTKLKSKAVLLTQNPNFKKYGLLGLIPVVLVLFLILWAVYTYSPLVRVKIFIESRAVEAEKTFTGDPSTIVFDAEAGDVRVKRETVTKSLSDNTQATGKDFRGTKAGGLVSIKCFLDEPTSIPAGTTLTSDGDLKFVTISDVTMVCPDITEVTVEAADVGEEYNLASGTFFTVEGFDSGDVNAVNETSSFAGGAKEEFKVVSQADIDKVVDTLEDTGYGDAKEELEALERDGWRLIDSSIKNALDGGVSTDVAVGAEADLVNVSIKTESSALFYKADDIEGIAEQLLLDKAQKDNLFESEEDLDLNLDEEIAVDTSVEKVEGNTVTVKLTVSGKVKPTVDKNILIDQLEGKGWQAGLDFLGDLKFVAKNTEVRFTPDWFPDGLRHFPSRQGRILLDVEEVEASDNDTPADNNVGSEE